VSYIRTLPLRPVPDDVEEVEFYFAFRGNYILTKVRSDATQEDIEKMGGNQFHGNLCLTDFHPPTEGTNYRF
jgi:hypothetical protein